MCKSYDHEDLLDYIKPFVVENENSAIIYFNYNSREELWPVHDYIVGRRKVALVTGRHGRDYSYPDYTVREEEVRRILREMRDEINQYLEASGPRDIIAIVYVCTDGKKQMLKLAEELKDNEKVAAVYTVVSSRTLANKAPELKKIGFNSTFVTLEPGGYSSMPLAIEAIKQILETDTVATP